MQPEKITTLAQVLAFLEQNPEEHKAFAKDPAAFFKKLNVEKDAFDVGHGEKNLANAKKMLDAAKLHDKETFASAVPKLSEAAAKVFGPDYRVQVEPFAINFMEKAELRLPFKWTITGRVRCTWDGWDGCSIGLDW